MHMFGYFLVDLEPLRILLLERILAFYPSYKPYMANFRDDSNTSQHEELKQHEEDQPS